MIRTGPLEAYSMCEMLMVGPMRTGEGSVAFMILFSLMGYKWQEVKS